MDIKPEIIPNTQSEEGYQFYTKPYEHQRRAFDISKDEIEYALFMEMGTGKTKVLIDNAAYLFQQGKITGLVVIAPKAIYRNWIAEIETHCPIATQVCYYDSYLTSAKLKEIQNFLSSKSINLKVLLVNTEAFSSKKVLPFVYPFVKFNRVMIAIDESTSIKSPTALRTKELIKVGSYAKYRRILTGSPITHSPLDLYSQCMFLSPHLLGFKSFVAFRSRYAVLQQVTMGNRSFHIVSGFQRLEELQVKLKRFSYRVTKTDCLDLPPKVYVTRTVELSDEQNKMYTQMAKFAVLEIERLGLVSAPIILNKLEKLHQIVCGHLKTDTGVTINMPNGRITELLHVLEETSGKVLIWCAYREDVRLIKVALNKAYNEDQSAMYYGDTSQDGREVIRRRFQDPKDPLRFFISTMATGKFGATLTQADVEVYYSNTNNLEYRIQSEDRAHRIGSEIHEKITIIDLVAPKTVDEKYLKNIKKKTDLANEVTDAIKDGSWRQYFNVT